MKSVLLLLLACSFSFASDLEIESVSITDSGQPKGLNEHSGDYITVVTVRNTSKNPIQVARYSASTYFRSIKSGEIKVVTDFFKYNSMCCHAPVYDTIEVNQLYTIRYRDSSKNMGKKAFLRVSGKNGAIELGNYTIRLTKQG